MKTKFLITSLIACALIFQIMAQTTPLTAHIANTQVACISPDEKALYAITWIDNEAKIISYNLSNGKEIHTYNSKLPNNPITLIHAVPNSPYIYLISTRKIDDTQNRYLDAIYHFNTKKDYLKLVYTENYNHKAPYRVGMVADYLVFTTQKEPTRIYNIKKKQTTQLNHNTDYQLLSIAPEQNGYLQLNPKNTLGNHIPVYYMNSDGIIGDSVGAVNPNLIIETNKGVFQLPTLSLKDSTYSWAIDAIRYNCFPLYSIKIGIHPFWLKQVYNLEKADELSSIVDASKNYILTGNNQGIDLYNITYKEGGLSSEDINEIEYLVKKRGTSNRITINTEITNKIFNAVFYHVASNAKDLNSINRKLVVQQYGSYDEIKDCAQLFPYFNSEFTINTPKDALTLQEAFGALYPIDEYNRMHAKHYKTDSSWIFIRGKAFDNYYGISVQIDETAKPVSVKYIKDLNEHSK